MQNTVISEPKLQRFQDHGQATRTGEPSLCQELHSFDSLKVWCVEVEAVAGQTRAKSGWGPPFSTSCSVFLCKKGTELNVMLSIQLGFTHILPTDINEGDLS